MAELLKEVFSPVIEVYLNLEPAFVTHCVMQNLIDHGKCMCIIVFKDSHMFNALGVLFTYCN